VDRESFEDIEKLLWQEIFPGIKSDELVPHQRSYRQITFVFIFDNNDIEEKSDFFQAILGQVSSLNHPELLRVITAIHYLDIDQFYSIYSNCIPLFSVNDIAPIRQSPQSYPSEVIPGFLYLGDCKHGRNKDGLRDLGITHLIDATSKQLSQSVALELQIEYLAIDIEDDEDEDISPYFTHTNQFIQKCQQSTNHGKVLIHCHAGVSRSTSIVLAYLIESRLFPNLRQAISHVVNHRPIVCPNNSFQMQLSQYELEILGSNSVSTNDQFEDALLGRMTSFVSDYSENATDIRFDPEENVVTSKSTTINHHQEVSIESKSAVTTDSVARDCLFVCQLKENEILCVKLIRKS